MSDRPVRGFARPVIALVVAAAVIGAAIAASSYSGTAAPRSTGPSTSSETVTTSVPQSCSEDVYNSRTAMTMENVPVLLMQPGSTGYICVTYQSVWEGNSSLYQKQYFVNGIYPFELSIGTESCTASGGGTGTYCAETVSHSFVITASPASIIPTPTMDYVSMVYTVTALGSSTGFYDRSAPYERCSGMPMAVGYSQVNASDFAPIAAPSCPFLPFAPVGVSVQGIGVVYLPFG